MTQPPGFEVSVTHGLHFQSASLNCSLSLKAYCDTDGRSYMDDRRLDWSFQSVASNKSRLLSNIYFFINKPMVDFSYESTICHSLIRGRTPSCNSKYISKIPC